MRGATSNTPRPPIDHGISIHAPHAGRDQLFFPTLLLLSLFQSTRPMRGATAKRPIGSRIARISIHAPHAGRDCQAAHREPYCTNFNPRAPCGARLDVLFLHALTRCDFNPRTPCGARRFRYVTVAFVWSFQSTRPVRGATKAFNQANAEANISIHAPRAGRDGGVALPLLVLHPISIHAPRAGRDPLSRRGSPC